jgi:hypothetical protein
MVVSASSSSSVQTPPRVTLGVNAPLGTRPDSASAADQLTVTSLTYQPPPPWVPWTVA